MKFYEVQKYFSVVNYQIHPDPFFVNLKWYESLPADLKPVFDSCAKKAMEWSDTHWLASEADYMKTLQGKVAVNVLEDAARQAFVKKVKPVWAHYVSEGYFSQAEVDSALAAAK